MKRMFSTIIMPIAGWKPWPWERTGKKARPKGTDSIAFSVTSMNTTGMPRKKSLSASVRSACTSSWICPAPCLGESAPSRRSSDFQRLHRHQILSKTTRTRPFAPKWQRTYNICTRVKDDDPPTHLYTQACDPHTATLCSSQQKYAAATHDIIHISPPRYATANQTPPKQEPPATTVTAAELMTPPNGIPPICHTIDPSITNETDVKLNNARARTGVENENRPRPND